MRRILSILIVSAALVSCGGKEGGKKLLIMGRGAITANGTDITLKEGAGHAEQEIDLEDKVTDLSVDAGEGKKTMKIPAETGYYILNLKKDTLVGSLQKLGKDLSRADVITQEELKRTIDSLQQLTTGANVKAGGINSFILPNEIKKVSSNVDARVYGPFTGIPASIDPGKDGKDPELYKFYTNTQLRERIATLKKATI